MQAIIPLVTLTAVTFFISSQALAAGALEQKTDQFIQGLAAKGGPPIYKLSPSDARKVLDSLQSGRTEKLPAQIEDRTIPAKAKGEVSLREDSTIADASAGGISIRIIRPKDSTGKLPVVMYFHGGGWVLGNAGTHDRLVREIANGAKAAVVFVNYAPSPEAKYPTAIEQAYAATKYVAEQGDSLNLNPSRLAVAGDSVGGNMATVVTLLAKERGGPKIDAQVLFYPVTDLVNLDNASYRQFANGPWLTKPAMEWFINAYAPDVSARTKPTLSPLRASIEQLKGLPPALVITDENDVLRDEGEAYAQKLMQAGVNVTAVRYLGTIHDFVMLDPLSDTPAARSAIALANAHLQQALAK
jgi:acetyl esterase/lipase